MRVSQEFENMIGILVYCGRAGDQNWVLSGHAADAVPTSRIYGAKIVNALANCGLIETRRGRRGGIRLARPATKISLGDVMRVTAVAPFDSTSAQSADQYGKAMDRILRSFDEKLESMFDAFTLADLLDGEAIGEIVASRLDARTCPFAAPHMAAAEQCRRTRRLAAAAA